MSVYLITCGYFWLCGAMSCFRRWDKRDGAAHLQPAPPSAQAQVGKQTREQRVWQGRVQSRQGNHTLTAGLSRNPWHRSFVALYLPRLIFPHIRCNFTSAADALQSCCGRHGYLMKLCPVILRGNSQGVHRSSSGEGKRRWKPTDLDSGGWIQLLQLSHCNGDP